MFWQLFKQNKWSFPGATVPWFCVPFCISYIFIILKFAHGNMHVSLGGSLPLSCQQLSLHCKTPSLPFLGILAVLNPRVIPTSAVHFYWHSDRTNGTDFCLFTLGSFSWVKSIFCLCLWGPSLQIGGTMLLLLASVKEQDNLIRLREPAVLRDY